MCIYQTRYPLDLNRGWNIRRASEIGTQGVRLTNDVSPVIQTRREFNFALTQVAVK